MLDASMVLNNYFGSFVQPKILRETREILASTSDWKIVYVESPESFRQID